MRITGAQHDPPVSDLTTRARIRNAAIACFAEHGFDASFRAIASRAGVSPGLITHHFGSKEALRVECDAEVLRRYQALKSSSVADPSGYLFKHLAEPGPAAQLIVYMLRAIHAGGNPAREFLEHLVDNAREIMKTSVESGLVRPSRDEEARTRYMAYQTMGAMLIQFLTMPDRSPDAFIESMRDTRQNQILPSLELFTEGFLADRSMLDDYLRHLEHSPDSAASPHSQSASRQPPTAPSPTRSRKPT
ncbi:MAG: TetR family transcriptional regulator [Actinobacteria bacterium 69-20]|nr:TetR family transcriptional regulator [Actinomycetota bacterium]OJV23154.1 MAG: TetR family transcriptional regulator [Actinobacteria bacterium 69-20]